MPDDDPPDSQPEDGVVATVPTEAEFVQRQMRVLGSAQGAPRLHGAVIIAESGHQGPIPSPSTLRDYDQLQPGLSAVIVGEWRAETKHRRELEQRHQKAVINDEKRRRELEKTGQRAGLIVAISAFVLAGFCVYLDHATTAAIIASIDVLGLVSVFVIGRTTKANDD